MKIFPHYLITTTILFLISFNSILNDDCKFRDETGKTVDFKKDNLNDSKSEEEKKQKCFSFSNSFVQPGKCCYDKIAQTCVAGYPGNETIDCPKEALIYNNCGKCGIYEPEDPNDCTEISLVKGYCCYVKFKSDGKSCLRTKILNKDVNSTTEQMKNYIGKIKSNAEVEQVICKGFKLEYSLLLIIYFLFIY